jgi:RHS repeat-associated protein
MPTRHESSAGYRYGYQGSEKDDEVIGEGNSYTTEFRQLDPRLGRWLSVDPLASNRSWMSPYNFVQNNTINRVDSDGQLDNPIYDTDGNFLGTDDKGLQGDAIVMDESNFTQSMSHEEAMKHDLGVDYLKHDVAAKTQLMDHYNSLPSRPDYHGRVTFLEALRWYNQGEGKPLYIDIGKLNFKSSTLTVTDFKGKSTLLVNFFVMDTNKEALHRPAELNLGGVFGTLTINLLDKNGNISLSGENGLIDKFDFRNKTFKNIAEYSFPEEGKDFKIYGYGTGEIWKNTTEINDDIIETFDD